MYKKLMVIDGNSLLHRGFYAIPILTTKKGVFTNAVYGFLNMLIKLLNDYEPNSIAVAFDTEAPTFRHKAYREYKGTRQKAPEELVPQFELIRDVIKQMNITIYEKDGYEADDILGTLSKACGNEDQHVLLVTGDRDALQLVTDYTDVLYTKKGITVTDRYVYDKIQEEYGLTPNQLIDMKGLMGDNSDNIPGVPGIGPKTSVKLVKEYGSLENVLDNVDNISGKKLKENLVIYRHQALLSKELATINLDAPIDCSAFLYEYEVPKTRELKEMLLDLEFNSIIDRLGFEDVETSNAKETKIDKTYKEISDKEELDSLIKQLMEEESIALLLGEDLTISSDSSMVYHINFKDDLISPGLDYLETLNLLKPVFESEKIKKTTYDLKHLIIELNKFNIKANGFDFDVLIGAYLLEPTRNKYDLVALIYDYLHFDVSNADAADLILLSDELKECLEAKELVDLYKDIEHPLIEVLASMEIEGFKVDKNILQEMDDIFTEELKVLTDDIYNLAGDSFNINSPKQLGEILFDKLKLPVVKKTKTGYSTDIEVLEKLQSEHPIIEKIIDYRQVSKLKSTYIDGLLHVISPKDGKIHSSFNQTVTATGRISSTDPNLQNIPVRDERGRRIRKVFTASDEDHILVDADYSQIELRVLAHISDDPRFIDAFKANQDIHTRTASEIFDVSIEEVTPRQRGDAKAVNFGIVYGISDFGLAKNLNISREKAKEYIDIYLSRYPKVKEYMDSIVKEGKKQGYVTTIMNRRRDLPELKSRNYNIRSSGERFALNTPIQGSAADIIKKAMIDVYRELKERGLKSKLILQVHDELIIDTCKDELDEVKALLKDKMENTVELSVPLEADISIGYNWYDAK